MLSINVKGESVNTLKESYNKTVASWFGVCPICHKPYHRHGTYPRKTPYPFGPSSIQRVYCENCKISHALLPCFIIPYARVLDVIKEAAIAGICLNTHTIEELAEFLSVDPTTIARWWRIFRNKAGVLMTALAQILANTPQLSYWASGPLTTWSERARKILELIDHCQTTFSPDFKFCRFAWANIFNPYLMFSHKGSPAGNTGSAS